MRASGPRWLAWSARERMRRAPLTPARPVGTLSCSRWASAGSSASASSRAGVGRRSAPGSGGRDLPHGLALPRGAHLPRRSGRFGGRRPGGLRARGVRRTCPSRGLGRLRRRALQQLGGDRRLTRAVLSGSATSGPLLRPPPAVALIAIGRLRPAAQRPAWTSLTALKLLPLVLLVLAFALARARGPRTGGPTVDGARGAGGHVRHQGSRSFLGRRPGALVRSGGAAGDSRIAGARGRARPAGTACVSALPDLAASRAPLADTAGALAGPQLARLVAAGTSVSALRIAFHDGHHSALPLGRQRRSLSARPDVAARRTLRALVLTWVVDSLVVNLGESYPSCSRSRASRCSRSSVPARSLLVPFAATAALSPLAAWPALPTLAVAAVLVALGATLTEATVALGTTRSASCCSGSAARELKPLADPCASPRSGAFREVDGGDGWRPPRRDGIEATQVRKAWDERDRIVTARTRPGLLGYGPRSAKGPASRRPACRGPAPGHAPRQAGRRPRRALRRFEQRSASTCVAAPRRHRRLARRRPGLAPAGPTS